MQIYLTRHGQDEDNAEGILNGHRDRPLTPKGVDQAQALAEGIKNSKLTFGAVYTSPLCRARKTAEIICNVLGLAKPILLPLLIERDFGEMTGRKISDIEKLHTASDIIKTPAVTYFLSPKGGETFPTLRERGGMVVEFVKQIHNPGQNVLLVTSGSIGKMIYSYYYGLPWREVLVDFHFGNCDLFRLDADLGPEVSSVLQTKQHN